MALENLKYAMALEDLKKNTSFKKQYKMVRAIGKGAFGTVHLAEHKKEKKQYAVKVVRTRDRHELKEAQKEIQIFKDLVHPHIVHYKDDFEISNGVAVVMEYCENGDMQTRIAKRNPVPDVLDFFPESQVVEWATEICKALQYLHSKNILHRDLKPANIFLAKDDVIKLGDFGVARKLADAVDVAMTTCGTPLYISPEIVQNKPYNHKSDVWSAGCCFYEIMTLNHAIDPIPVRLSRQWNVRPMPLAFFSRELCDVVALMLTIDCNERPPIADILQKLLRIQTSADNSPLPTPTVEIDLCKGVQSPPTPPQRPSSAQTSPPTAQTLPATAHDSPIVLGDKVKLRGHHRRRSSLDSIVCRAKETLDHIRTPERHSVNFGSGTPGVGQDSDAMGQRSSTSSGDGGQKSRSRWYSTEDVDKSPGDGFWTISDSTIVQSLADLGVKFNDHGQLIQLATGERFVFKYFSKDKTANQLRYEEIGEQVTLYVYNLLETKLRMKRVLLPTDAGDEPRSFIFVTDDYATNDKKLLVLVHGPGVPRAGQWSRKVIMNDCLAAGTQIRWIQMAVQEGFAVIVLNPNLNEHEVTRTPIRECEDGKRHALYVWDNVISTEVKAKKVAFAAHSAGSYTVLHLATEREKEFNDRVFAITLADSCLKFDANTKPSVINLFTKRARNWVSSSKPLDTVLTSDRDVIRRCSSGQTGHEWTAGSFVPSAFKFLNKRYKKN